MICVTTKIVIAIPDMTHVWCASGTSRTAPARIATRSRRRIAKRCINTLELVPELRWCREDASWKREYWILRIGEDTHEARITANDSHARIVLRVGQETTHDTIPNRQIAAVAWQGLPIQ